MHSFPSAWRATALALALALAAVVVPAAASDEEIEQFADDMDTQLGAMEEHLDDVTAPMPEMQIESTGDGPAAEMSRIVRDQLNAMIASRNGYLQQISAIGLERLLDATRLAGDTDMADSRRMLADARAAAHAAIAEQRGILTGFPDRIRAADLPPDAIAGMLKGVEQALPRAMAQLDTQFGLELQAYDEMDALVDLLASSAWENRDGQLLFRADADVARFNAGLARVQAIVQQQTDLQAAQIERARENIQELRE